MQTIPRNYRVFAVALLVIAALLGASFHASVAYAAPACASTGSASLDLWAKAGSITLSDGASLPIWGYAGTAGDLAGLPGPVLDVAQGTDVTINLTNELSEASALLFQGQAMIPDTEGAAPNGGVKSYTFRACNPGTFLYEAGLIPNGQHQVAMGLYGALIVRPAAAGQAYDSAGTAFDNESILVLSELDPALNNSADPAAFDMRNYSPQYFLINGQAFPGSASLSGDPGARVLLRYINAGLQAHAMSTLGLSQTILAQDGSPYNYTHRVIAETIAPGQTLDTLLNIPAASSEGDQFAVYDANMLLHNANGSGFGGMMTFLVVGAGAPLPPPDAGPVVSSLALSPNPTDGSVEVSVNAIITDEGADASTIAAAEFYIDGTTNPSNPMNAVDGLFDSNPEPVAGAITTPTLAILPSGNHIIYVRGQDANGNWGPFLSVKLNLDKTGPATTGLTLTPNPSSGMEDVALTATGDDTASGNSNVVAAEYWVDDGAHTLMEIVAGTDAPIRDFTATIPAPFSIGTHVVSVRSQDAFGNWGAAATIALQVADPLPPTTSNVTASPNPTNGTTGYNTSVPAVRVTADFSDVDTGGSNITAAEGFIDAVGSTGTGFVFIAADGSFNSPSESGYADIPLAVVRSLGDGDHTIYVHARDAGGNWGDPTLATTILTVDKTGPAFGPVTVSPPNAARGGGSVTVTVSGTITSLSDLNFSSGAYTITDSKSSAVVNGTFAIAPDGSFSFSTDISRSNSGPNNPSNRRYYTFTLSATDTLGNLGTATAQFYVQ